MWEEDGREGGRRMKKGREKSEEGGRGVKDSPLFH